MKRFNSNTVRASAHLAVTPEGTRRYDRAIYKAAIERSEGKQVVRVREYLAPVTLGFKPTGFGRGKRSKHQLVGISDVKFAAVTNTRAAIGKGVHLV